VSGKKWPVVPLSEAVRPVARPVAVIPGKAYRTLGVKWWGEGAYERETIDGSQTAAKTLSIVREGDLIINKIWVRHGSTAVVSKSVDGCAASGEFPTFFPIPERVLLRWLHWLTKTRGFWTECDFLSRGSSGKNRIKPELFLTIKIPLPPLAEQRRIVARIEELAAKIDEARQKRADARVIASSITDARLMHLFDDAAQSRRDQVRLGDVCVFEGGSQPPKLDFAYEPRDGYVRLIQIRDYKSEDHLTFVPQDSVRKFCTADDVMIGRYGPPIFQILRGIEGAYNVALMKATPNAMTLSREFLFYLLQEPRLFQKVEEDSQRTSGQSGIRKELLEEHVTFVPSLREQGRIVARLASLDSKVASLRELQNTTSAELDALLPSILDKAFKGEL
jgi:type I restriction enzyme S subunit